MKKGWAYTKIYHLMSPLRSCIYNSFFLFLFHVNCNVNTLTVKLPLLSDNTCSLTQFLTRVLHPSHAISLTFFIEMSHLIVILNQYGKDYTFKSLISSLHRLLCLSHFVWGLISWDWGNIKKNQLLGIKMNPSKQSANYTYPRNLWYARTRISALSQNPQHRF